MNPLVMHVAFAVAGWLFLVGLYGIITSKHLLHLCLCLTVVQASTYVLLTAIGYRTFGADPVFTDGVKPNQPLVDPVIQALMLTDVVVEATVVALLLAIAVQINKKSGNADPDDVDLMRG